jgi:hypothetical protein
VQWQSSRLGGWSSPESSIPSGSTSLSPPTVIEVHDSSIRLQLENCADSKDKYAWINTRILVWAWMDGRTYICMDGCEGTLVDARDVRTNTPNPGTGILLGSVGSDVMLSMASRRTKMQRMSKK